MDQAAAFWHDRAAHRDGGRDRGGQHRSGRRDQLPAWHGMACAVDSTKLSLTGIQFGQAVAAILVVLAISNEHSTGMIRITLAATPRRETVLPQGDPRPRPGAGGLRYRRANNRVA